jgi:hypothetical protein
VVLQLGLRVGGPEGWTSHVRGLSQGRYVAGGHRVRSNPSRSES